MVCVRLRVAALGALLALCGALVLTGCGSLISPDVPGGAVADGGDRFGRNLPVVESAVAQFSTASAITTLVLSVRSDPESMCEFGQSTARRWGRAGGAVMIVVIAGPENRREVCLNQAARGLLMDRGAAIGPAIAAFESLSDQQRWATAVTTLLKGLLPQKAGLLGVPDRDIEDGQPLIRAQSDRDEIMVYLITLVAPAVVLVALGAWCLRSSWCQWRRRMSSMLRR